MNSSSRERKPDMGTSEFNVRRYRSRMAPRPFGGTVHRPWPRFGCWIVTAGTTRDSEPMVPSTTHARVAEPHAKPPQPRSSSVRSGEGWGGPGGGRRGEEPRGAHLVALVAGVVGGGGAGTSRGPGAAFARACVLGKRESLANTCSDLRFCERGCVSHNTLTCGNVLVVPHRHPYLPTQLVQVRIVAGGDGLPGNTARIRCVGVDTKAPRQRVQICQLSLNNC